MTRNQLWFASMVCLPYVMYGVMLVIAYLIVTAMMQRGHQVWQKCIGTGFGWLTIGLLLSASFGINRGESFLQLTNFLPFFVLWGVWVTSPAMITSPFAVLERLARWLVLSAVPLCAIALIEYALKFEGLIPRIKASWLPMWLIEWLYEEPYFGHRARSLFDHPNVLSAYLVLVLGLGLGLVLKETVNRVSTTSNRVAANPSAVARYRLALGLSVLLCLGAIFCTGSRNGLLIALVLVMIALYMARRYKQVWISSVIGVGVLAGAINAFGIGGRSLSGDIFINDPRVRIWHLAIDMIYQRPWTGWGFSGLRELYTPGSIPNNDSIYHAHNIWLFLASESGVPVMIGFSVICGAIFYRALRTYFARKTGLPEGDRAILFSYLLAFFACLSFSLFDVVLFDARLNIAAWGLLAALYAMSAQGGNTSHRRNTP
ncbi:O-Antigen Polymerase family [Synechococcus sp. PCC 7335]|nr:O-Antigen Polymerase family [Synechococcus sp. PCC 7335]